MPSNCNDLKALGNSVNGFYTVKSTTGNKLMTIFCNFVKSNKWMMPITATHL